MQDLMQHKGAGSRAGMRRLAVILVSLTSLLVGSLAVASPAMAQTQTAPACGSPRPFGAMCYFYRPGGAEAGFVTDVPDLLSPIRWVYGPGAGQGQQVANNARAGHNRDTACNVTIYSELNFTGDRITLVRGTFAPTLGSMSLRNRGHFFHDCI